MYRTPLLCLVVLSLLAGCAARPTPSVSMNAAGQVFATPAAPQGRVAGVPGYLSGPDGSLLRNAHGQCWRTVEWRPALAIETCDPRVVRERQAAQLALSLAAVAPVPPADAIDSAASADAQPAAAPSGMPDLVVKPVVLNTDAAFFFGKDSLTRAGRDAVENLAAYIKLWNIEEVQVEVVGHTDRIGNARDNQGLSERRARAVRDVLVASGVPADSVSARGVGSTQPVTLRGDCPDDLSRCDLIGCLAPDRRVEVGLKGTRKAVPR